MKASLYLQYKQAALTIDLSQHVESVVKILDGRFFDVQDPRIHQLHLMNNRMRDILNMLRTDRAIQEMLLNIDTAMKKLDIDFNMDAQISNVNPSVFTIDTRSQQ